MAILYLDVIYNSNNNTVLHLLESESATINTTLLRHEKSACDMLAVLFSFTQAAVSDPAITGKASFLQL